MNRPSFGSVLRTGLPGLLREGVFPVAAFFAADRLWGLAAGIAASAALSLAVYAYERRLGRDGLLVRLSLVFVAAQSAVGLLSHSATVFLAAPVLANAAWGVAFLGSAAVRRPLAGALACAWYPFPREFRESAEFKRVYGVESVVWGLYFVARSAIRLTVLLHAGVGTYLVVVILTGTPAMLGVIAWSIWYAIRELSQEDSTIATHALEAPGR